MSDAQELGCECAWCVAHTGAGNRLDMAVVCAAAAAKHVDLRMHPHQSPVFAAKLLRIAGIEIGRRIELGVASL